MVTMNAGKQRTGSLHVLATQGTIAAQGRNGGRRAQEVIGSSAAWARSQGQVLGTFPFTGLSGLKL